MKRLPYISIIVVATAVSALLLNSCCKHKIEIVQQGEVIDFGVSEKRTKAVVENMDSLVSYCFADPDNPTGFGVYGYKTVLARNNDTLSSDRTFDNYEVIPTEKSASTSWTYSPLRYWDSWTEDRKVDYHFVAYFRFSAKRIISPFPVHSALIIAQAKAFAVLMSASLK